MYTRGLNLQLRLISQTTAFHCVALQRKWHIFRDNSLLFASFEIQSITKHQKWTCTHNEKWQRQRLARARTHSMFRTMKTISRIVISARQKTTRNHVSTKTPTTQRAFPTSLPHITSVSVRVYAAQHTEKKWIEKYNFRLEVFVIKSHFRKLWLVSINQLFVFPRTKKHCWLIYERVFRSH